MLILLLLLQQLQPPQLRTGTASDYAVPLVYRLSGKIVVGLDEPVQTVITLKPIVDGSAGTAVGQSMQSFANGTWRFDRVQLGTYTIEVADPRFNLYQRTLLLRQPADTGNDILVRLTRLGESNAPPSPDIELYTIDAQTKARIPAKAMDEYNKGLDAIRNPARKNPPDAHFKRAIAAAPDFYEAYMQLGLEQLHQNKNGEAIQSFEKATSLKPSEPRPLSLLGKSYLEAEKFDKVVEVLSRLDGLEKMSVRDSYALGTAHYRLEHLKEAEQHLLEAINSGNDADPAPFLQLHNVFIKMRDGGRALAVIEDYLKLFPTDSKHAAMTERAQQLRKMLKPPGR